MPGPIFCLPLIAKRCAGDLEDSADSTDSPDLVDLADSAHSTDSADFSDSYFNPHLDRRVYF